MNYKRWIFVAILLFSLSFIFGLFTPPKLASFISGDIAAIKELGANLALFSVITVIFIFIKNAAALLVSFVLSPILCLIPILALTANGWLLAFVSAAVTQQESLSYTLAGLLPHGILEIPALIIGQAAALSFGSTAMRALFKKESRSRLLPNLKQNLKYLLMALVLLVPAAIIEIYVTPLLLLNWQ